MVRVTWAVGFSAVWTCGQGSCSKYKQTGPGRREREVSQSCPTLCGLHGLTVAYQFPPSRDFPGNSTGVDCHSFSRDLPNPGLEPGSPVLQTDALPSEPPGKWEKVSIYLNLPAHTWRSQNLRRDPSHPIARALPNIEVGPVWGPSSDWSAHCRIALKQPTGLLFNRPAGSDSLPPHELQHARPPCASPSPRVCPSSWPFHR